MKIKIGGIAKPFGLKGEVKVKVLTDFPKERFKVGAVMDLVTKTKRQEVTVESVRNHQGNLLVKFVGFDSLNDVEGLHMAGLEVNRDALHDLGKDEYYFIDLVDCKVYVEGAVIGEVIEVMDMPAHPVLRVQTEEKLVMIPFVNAFIADVNLAAKRIDIKAMEGLL